MIPFKDFEELVNQHVDIPEEVIPKYRSKVLLNGETFYIDHDSPNILDCYDGPYNSIHTDMLNLDEYTEYTDKVIDIINRAEYCWYITFRELWKNLPEDVFQECYKESWDTGHKIGGWDKVAELMPSIVESKGFKFNEKVI